MTTLSRLAVLAAVALISAASAVAVRLPPKPVAPIVSNGVRYSAAGNGVDEYVIAADSAAGYILWKVRVRHNWIWHGFEEDV